MADGFMPLPNGLLVPGEYWDGLIKAKETVAREKRGRFFHDYMQLAGAHPGVQDKPGATPAYAFLRTAARESVIDRVIIEARVAQIKRVARPCWVPGKQIGYRVVHERHADSTFEMTPAIQARCRNAMRMLERVNTDVHSTIRDFLAIAVEEELALDRKAMVIYKDRVGRPTRYHLLDGATIKPTLHVLAPYMVETAEPNRDRAAQKLSEELYRVGQRGIDLTKARYVQELDGQIVGAWTADEMDVDTTNPTVEIDKVLYGRSLLEKSLRLTNTFANIWRYNDELFRTNIPERLLLLYGDYDEEGLQAFRNHILAEQSVGGNWRMPVLPAGPQTEGVKGEVLNLRESPKDAMFVELMQLTANLKCAIYRAHPSIVNFTTLGNAGGLINNVNEETQIALFQEEGFHGLLDSLASWITRALVKPFDKDLILIWEGLGRMPEEKRVEIRLKELNYHTLNEVRAKDDLPPLAEGVPLTLGDMILNPIAVQALGLIAEAVSTMLGLDATQPLTAPDPDARPGGPEGGPTGPQAKPNSRVGSPGASANAAGGVMPANARYSDTNR